MTDLPELLRYADAAKVLDPSGHLSERAIRTEVDKGRLRKVKIGKRVFIRRDDLAEFLERASQCRETTEDISGNECNPEVTESPDGSFAGTIEAADTSAQAAMSAAQKLIDGSKKSSCRQGSRPKGPPAPVVQLHSKSRRP